MGPTDRRIDIDRQVAVGVAVATTHYYVIPALDLVHGALAVRRTPT